MVKWVGKISLATALVAMVLSCSVYDVRCPPCPCIDIPEDYNSEEKGQPWCFAWWEEFNDPELNAVIASAFERNLTIQQAWNRLLQSRASVCIANSQHFFQVDLNVNGTKTLSNNGAGGFGGGFVPGDEFGFGGGGFQGGFSRFLISGQLAYEVDMWRKIDSEVQAACLEYRATKDDLDATALMLTGTITELWFTIEEQRALLKLLDEQIEANKTQLELIELRFTVGESSALDVYQQRLTLAETESQVPPVRSRLKTTINQLQVLLAFSPGSVMLSEEPKEFSLALPSFPSLGTPVQLLQNRPDLRAAQRRLIAADYEVAVAVADRFPQIGFFLDGTLLTQTLNQLFQQQFLSIAGNLLAPLFDGNRRLCEVERRKAVVWELLNGFGDSFLVAMQEIEDAVVQEQQQILLLEALKHQESISKDTLRESQIRYINGLTNYLDVIAAITSLQEVQRRIITEKKNLLLFRAHLYRALGGRFNLAPCFDSSCAG